MSAEQIAALTAIAQIVKTIGAWPVGLVILVAVIGPWVFAAIGARNQDRRIETVAQLYRDSTTKNEERMRKVLEHYREDVASIKQLYENNVGLVKDYDRALKENQALASELAGIIHLNTQVQTRLIEKINNNMFCPVVREKGPGGKD